MIEFIESDNKIIFSYTPEFAQDENWVLKTLEEKDKVYFKKTFTFHEEDIFNLPGSEEDKNIEVDEYESVNFLFAILSNDYYKIRKGILINKHEIYFHKDIPFDISFFVADSNISVFRNIEPLINADIYIGGDDENAIPFIEFERIISKFPNSYEKKIYAEARITSILRNYFDTIKDSEKIYQVYINKKGSKKGEDLTKTFQDMEIIKYQRILDKLQGMLNTENSYTEKQWQIEILQIILLLNPKYIFVFKEVPIRDKQIKERFLDFLLVDSNGHVDIVEIKRPFDKCIITEGKYRDNHIPLRELSGTIMQIEKYIYYLNRWGPMGEKFLTEKYQNELPKDFEIKITNPSGIVIMGREKELNKEQKQDFEVVKRKYKNVVDIITYDNLLERLKYIIEQMKKI